MAELLVMTRRHGPAFAGDVVTVQPDGWGWTEGEANKPSQWVVLRLPGVPVHALQHLTESARGLYRRIGLNLLALGRRPSLDELLAARIEKTLVPLLT